MSKRTRVLLAEDDADLRASMVDALEAEGLEVVGVPDGVDVRAYIDDCVFLDLPKPRVHALVTDLAMPGMGGQELLEYLASLGRALPTVVVTGMPDADAEVAAAEPAVHAVLRKPFDLQALCRVVLAALASEDGSPHAEADQTREPAE
jgi:DNA-binding NtrC family response regulator